MIMFTQNMKTKKLYKKHMKIQRTQPSLQTFAYNEGRTRHKTFGDVFIIYCKLIKKSCYNKHFIKYF